MYNSTEKVILRVDLTDETAREFEAIKNHLGLKLNTEVIRALIKEAYKEILSQSPRATPGPHEGRPLHDAPIEAQVEPERGGSFE